LLNRVVWDVQLVSVRPHVGERDLRRLLHHIAQLAGEQQPAATISVGVRGRGLDEEHVATRPGDGKSCRDAGHRGARRHFVVELGLREFAHAVGRDRDRRRQLPVATFVATCA